MVSKSLVQQILEKKRKQVAMRGGKLRLPKPPRPLPPDAPARAYAREMKPLVGYMQEVTRKKIIPEIDSILEKAA